MKSGLSPKFLKEGQHGWVGAQLIRIPGAPGHIDGIVVFDCSLFDARINWNPAGILGELDGQNMRGAVFGWRGSTCGRAVRRRSTTAHARRRGTGRRRPKQ
jgi:hypothetical protein